MEKINRRLYLRVTNKCNRQCSFCYYRDDSKKLKDMSLDTLKDIMAKEIKLLPENKYLRVEVSGGEPSLCENINEIIDYLISIPKVYVALETNGTNLMATWFLELLLKLKKPHFLKISLNSELIDSDTN
jgi:sulfatase maturation enzyme AslB (radical SAM superfamily)